MVAFYIAFMEADVGKPSVVEFTYIYCIKALAKNEGFWYTNKRGPDVEGVWGLREITRNYKNIFFFYPSKCFGDFRITSE